MKSVDFPSRGTAVWITTIQGLLALTWALYVAFLPGLLAAAGIDKSWVVFFLMFDQAVFAISDWAAGVYADRLQRTLGRVGPVLIAVALLSSLALLALPWIAQLGQPVLLIAATAVWSATSSSLRAPVFTLLGRIGDSAREPGTISIALVGIGVASAIAPMVTQALASFDARLPLGIAGLVLALAALAVTKFEIVSTPARAPEKPPEQVRFVSAFYVAALVFIAAFGTQIHTVVLAQRQPVSTSLAVLWVPMFWTGFALGLAAAAWISRAMSVTPASTLRIAILALSIGVAALIAAQAVSQAIAFTTWQALAGAAWAIFIAAAVRIALSSDRGSGVGGSMGLIFSALALASLLRLTLGPAGFLKADWIVVAPVMTWLLVSGLLARALPSAARAYRSPS